MDVDDLAIHILQAALEGRTDDMRAIGRKLVAGIQKSRPDLGQQAQQAAKLLAAKTPMRFAAPTEMPMPVDNDSRLNLMRREEHPELPLEPTWPPEIQSVLDTVVAEREREALLAEQGLAPTRSLLLIGPPGVGKTLSARWLARRLDRPLLTLDLAAVMSSLLGRTGNNIRVVLDYAKRIPSVLLLDEFDAIAKRRDDLTEIGELKRLVTVLLQAVDDWPSSGILLAATNHPELLDPAVWRRFDHILQFPLPGSDEIRRLLANLLGGAENVSPADMALLIAVCQGKSFADITREIKAIHRRTVLSGQAFPQHIREFISPLVKSAAMNTRIAAARELFNGRYSQRFVSEVTGLSRSTLRKHFPTEDASNARRFMPRRKNSGPKSLLTN
jgi:SpoVK/Ycf46/Vps4 family AAA+-type ATPase